MKKLKIGIVGAGFVAHIHINAYTRVLGVPVEVAGIYSEQNAEEFAQKFKIPHVYQDYREMLDDPEIDIVDVCVPNIAHARICIEAAQAGKHLICEKPLTGAFGEGRRVVSRLELYKEAMKNADAIIAEAERNKIKICYAEDYIYAPPVVKAKRLLTKSEGAILEMRSEESHSGSHAVYARYWKLAGGGSLLRLGSHPMGLVLHLKHWEGNMKQGRPTQLKSVTAEVGNLTHTEVYKQSTHRWLVDEWDDVEDWATVVLTFEDGTRALVNANDTTLGGVVNTFDVYTSNSVIKCNMSANDSVKAYAPADGIFRDEYITEKIQTKAGWSFPSPDEDWMRGYPQEMQDFVEAVYYDRPPISDGELGRQVVQAIYAAYLSAEQGRRIDLAELKAISYDK